MAFAPSRFAQLRSDYGTRLQRWVAPSLHPPFSLVDINSTRYSIARRYMIRLRRDDFENPHELARFAATCGMSVDDFRQRFEYLVQAEPPALSLVGKKD